MKNLILIILLLIPIKSFAWFDEWTTQDTILQVSYGSLLFIDGYYTYQLLKHEDIIELNPYLKVKPDAGTMFRYGAGLFLLNTTISYILPKKYRTIWQSISIGIEIDATYRNFLVSTSLKLP